MERTRPLPSGKHGAVQKTPDCALSLAARGRPMKTVCEVLGVARSAVVVKRIRSSDWRDGRRVRVTDDTGLIEEIQ